jgi:hypothetical protein
MWVEQRQGGEFVQERTRLERSFGEASRRFRARQEELQELRRSGDADIVAVADAALAFEAMDTRVRFIREQLRRLSSTADYAQHRIEPVMSIARNEGSMAEADATRWIPSIAEHAPPAQPAAESRLEVRRDSLRRAASVVRLCPDAGEPADLAELTIAFERAAEETLPLDDRLLSGERGGPASTEGVRQAC